MWTHPGVRTHQESHQDRLITGSNDRPTPWRYSDHAGDPDARPPEVASIDESEDVDHVLTDLQDAIAHGDLHDVAALVDHLGRATQRFPQRWLELLRDALREGRWDGLSAAFAAREFIGPRGDVLLLGRYRQQRDGVDHDVLSMLCGRLKPRVDLGHVAAVSEDLFGHPPQNPPEAIGIEVSHAAGAVGGAGGEAFVVPDGWGWTESHRGPAFNDMTEQRKRFGDAMECIKRILDEPTAALLTGLVGGVDGMVEAAAMEYGLHDAAGHGNGIHLSEKLGGGHLPNATYCGFEEFRADGVALEVAGRMFGPERAGRIAASNTIVRLGLDAHRLGGLDADTDAQCTLLHFHHLLESGLLAIEGSTGRLTLARHDAPTLWRAFKPQRDLAIRVTQCELGLKKPAGLSWLYATHFNVPASSRHIFQEKVVAPCLGVHSLK
ncbi:MAG: DUF6014 family protein [Phycisphaera sp.]|nr:MAG: DUF6014 family protein [Phycisphaera sp.]